LDIQKKIFDDREREQGLDHSEEKPKNCDKMSFTDSIELKQVALDLVLDQNSDDINLIWICEKKFFDENFSKSRIFDFQSSIKSELLTRSSSKEQR